MHHISTLNENEATYDITLEVIEYVPTPVLQKTIVHKNHEAVSVNYIKGSDLLERRSAYDTFVQVIHGSAQIRISDKRYTLALGEGVIVPANVGYYFVPGRPFKVVASMIRHDK